MNKCRLFLIPVSFLLINVSTTRSEGVGKDGEIIFNRPVGDRGQSFVVVRGPDCNKALLPFWNVAGGAAKQIRNLYEVRAELRSPGLEPILLASYLRAEDFTDVDRGIVVLDMLVNPREIILCVAQGPRLLVWKIAFEVGTFLEAGPAAGEWAMEAAPYELSEKMVGASLGRAPDGRLTINVVDKMSGQHSIFEQVEEKEESFKRIRQWREAHR